MYGKAPSRIRTIHPAFLPQSMKRESQRSALPARGARRFFLILLMLATAAGTLSATAIIEATVAGSDPNNWSVGSFGPADIASPGSEFTVTTHTGVNPTVTMNVTVIASNPTMRITLSKNADEATTWNSQYTLWVYPVSTGTGSGGGNYCNWSIPTGAWTQITATETQICTLRRSRTGITLRLELRNKVVAAGTTASTPSFTTTLNYLLYTN